MKLVTQTDACSNRFGDEEAVRILCEAGYDGLDYSMFAMKNDNNCVLNTDGYKEHALKLKEKAASYGVTFEQAHAPFPSAKAKDEGYNRMIMPKLIRSIEVAGILGVKIIVVHPVYWKHHKFEKNMELYHTLEPYAADNGVKIALENMWGRGFKDKIIPNVCSVAKEFNEYVDALNPEYFTACLDLGHCGLVGDNAADMIRQMGRERLGALHIHDNDNIHDSHTLPYTRNMNWDEILRALGEINYSGNFTFEADNFLNPLPDDLFPAACRFMAETGRNMIKAIEGYRK